VADTALFENLLTLFDISGLSRGGGRGERDKKSEHTNGEKSSGAHKLQVYYLESELTLNPPCIILFARAPVPGQVKTRLLPLLGPEGASDLHRRLVADALTRLAPHGDLELHTDSWTDAWPDFTGPRRVQSPGDLGARMLEALQSAPHTMVVGSDAPAFPEGHLRMLLASTADVALGPTEDGGFYAIATRRTHSAMFTGVEWSSGLELRQTIRACEACGLTVELGPRWFDIDTPEDLERARAAGIV
jgi:rSAM/selenodomain-associated transferase 1